MNKKIELTMQERINLYSIIKIKIDDNLEFIDKFKDDTGLNFVIECSKNENKILSQIAVKLDI